MSAVLRLLSLLAPYWWRVAAAAVLGVVTVASGMGLLGMAAYLIAAAALKPLLITLTLPVYLVRLASVSRALARYAERLWGHDVTFRLLARVRSRFYAGLVPLAPAWMLRYRSGDLLARSVKDVEELQHIYLGIVSPIIVALASAGLAFGLLRAFGAAPAWTALALLTTAGVATPLLVAALGRGWGRRYIAARAAMSTQVVDGIQGVRDLLACGAAAEHLRAAVALDRIAVRAQRRLALAGGVGQAAHDLLANLAAWLVLVLTIPLVSARAVDGVYLAVLPLVVLVAFEGVQPLGPAFQSLGRAAAAGGRLFEVLDAHPAVVTCAAPLPRPASYGLEFERVRFSYGADAATQEGADNDPALDGVSFAVRPGRRVAVVGPSGAGKSTLARLALRFWDPASGTVRLGGHDVSRYALDDLRAAIGIVAQDTYIFNDTIRGNLLLARPDADDATLRHALEAASLAAFVDGLPDGLDTRVGEQGARLSGGERQRLAIARALLKDAPLLILDEPTAHLDPLTERAVLDALDLLMRGRTTLFITHRLVALERMDEIVVLAHGRVAERGSHDSLCAAGGLYRRLLDAQNAMLAL